MRKGLLGLVATISILVPTGIVSAHAKAKPAGKLQKVQIQYVPHTKTITFSGNTTGKKVQRVVLMYGGKKRTITHNKQQKFSISYRFKGYKSFSLYGATQHGKRVTKQYHYKAAKYATAAPMIVQASRNAGKLTITATVKKGTRVLLIDGNEQVLQQTNAAVKSGQVTLKLPDTFDTKYHLSLIGRTNNRKTSLQYPVPVLGKRTFYVVN